LGVCPAYLRYLGYVLYFEPDLRASFGLARRTRIWHIYPSMQIRKKLAKALGVGPQELWNIRPEDLSDQVKESKKQAL
jgi:hypothetical protein